MAMNRLSLPPISEEKRVDREESAAAESPSAKQDNSGNDKQEEKPIVSSFFKGVSNGFGKPIQSLEPP